MGIYFFEVSFIEIIGKQYFTAVNQQVKSAFLENECVLFKIKLGWDSAMRL